MDKREKRRTGGLAAARMTLRGRLRGRFANERGLTIIEVMVAAIILVIGAFAIFKIVDAATRTSYRAEQSQVVSNLLQRELERVKARETGEIAVSAKPSDCPIPLAEELQSRWTSERFDGRRWITAPSDADNPIKPCERLDSVGTGDDESGDVSVNVYRMVTWYDPDNENCLPPDQTEDDAQACGMRRIIIGAKPVKTGPGGERAYREIQSDVIDEPQE